MEIHIDMQGWYAVIVGEDVVAAFINYEDAMLYRKSIENEGREVIVEKITHRRG